jgi:hypothetical protein
LHKIYDFSLLISG